MLRDSQWLRCLCLALLASSAQAQAATRSPKDIGAIINAALAAAIPAQETPATHTVAGIAGRNIRLDYGRTLAAFGLANNADVRAKLGIARAATDGSTVLLEGCDQMGMGACEQLGRSVYVYAEPIAITDSDATVRLHVDWATKMPSKRTYRSTWITEVILRRSGAGSWTFVKMGKGIIS